MPAHAAEPSGHRDAVFGLAEREGRVLLVLNPRVREGQRLDCWDLPGGGVRAGETLPEALAREWHEEVGLEAEVGELLLVVDGSKQHAGGSVLYTWRAFVFCVGTTGEARPGKGIAEVDWVAKSDAAARLDAPYHAALRAWLAGDGRRYGRVTWTEPAATAMDAVLLPRALLVVAAAAAVGDRDLLARELRAACAADVAPARLVETLLQLVPYAGYPRAITAFSVLADVLPEAPPSVEGTEDREASAARGARAFEAVYGDTAASVRRGLDALDPVLARWTLEHAYGRVLAREGVLTLLERELLAVSILTALGGLGEPLLGHMRACVRLGAAVGQVAGAVDVVPASVGEGRRAAARALLARLVPSDGPAAPSPAD